MIKSDLYQTCLKGGYADFFEDRVDNTKIYKVFKKYHNDNDFQEQDFIEQVCESEAEAYELAMKSPRLLNIVPTYYFVNNVVIHRLFSIDDIEISQNYYLELFFCVELIKKESETKTLDFLKQCKVSSTVKGIHQSILDFHEVGINYMQDSSLIFTSEHDYKFIDFALIGPDGDEDNESTFIEVDINKLIHRYTDSGFFN
ncbi:MAG: hypothetical protein M0P99_04725 [Candidatus Cloacimonetes bacterium]|nr:hypothetical protein [Candidatus Cloacimonadota bacterium]